MEGVFGRMGLAETISDRPASATKASADPPSPNVMDFLAVAPRSSPAPMRIARSARVITVRSHHERRVLVLMQINRNAEGYV